MFAEGIIDQTWQCVLQPVLWACLSSEEVQVTGSAAAGFFLRVFGVFPGPRTLGGQWAMVKTGGLGRDPLARQMLVCDVYFVCERFPTDLPQDRNQNSLRVFSCQTHSRCLVT